METVDPSTAIELAKRVLEAEAAALVRLAGSLGPEHLQALDLIAGCKGKVVFTGVGKSGLVARKVAATMSSLGTPSVFLHSWCARQGAFTSG